MPQVWEFTYANFNVMKELIYVNFNTIYKKFTYPIVRLLRLV